MAVRPIDGDALRKELTCNFAGEPFHGNRKVTIGEVRRIIESMPTLTPQNEWISVEERLPEPGDLIVYADNTVWGYQYGICRVCGKEKAFDYWIPLQDPPNNRPPEGEEDT